MNKQSTFTFILAYRGDRSVGENDTHDKVTVTFEKSTFDLYGMQESLTEYFSEVFQCDCYVEGYVKNELEGEE